MLKVNNISFNYPKKKTVLTNFSFSLNPGEHLCVMGESGSGKSTLLKAIYGLLDLNEGEIYWKENQVLGPAYNLVPGMSFFKYVAQDFDLMPYISVSENIGKFLSRFYPKEKEKRTEELLEVIELTNFKNTLVKNLSGGQQQRVAIARALAKEPELILLDEPFSQIDNFKKNTLRRRLFAYLKKQNIACIVATHDTNDALSFADKLIIIKDHKILANDSPKKLYSKPTNVYIASLFDDINEIIIEGKTRLLYPNQIKLVENSNHNAEITNCYYKGYYWLIEANYNNQVIFFSHPTKIASGNLVNIDFFAVPKN